MSDVSLSPLAAASAAAAGKLALAAVVLIDLAVVGVLLLWSRAQAFAVVLNEWIAQQEYLAHLERLEVKAVGVLLSLRTPEGRSTHDASRAGAAEIFRILRQLAAEYAESSPTLSDAETQGEEHDDV